MAVWQGLKECLLPAITVCQVGSWLRHDKGWLCTSQESGLTFPCDVPIQLHTYDNVYWLRHSLCSLDANLQQTGLWTVLNLVCYFVLGQNAGFLFCLSTPLPFTTPTMHAIYYRVINGSFSCMRVGLSTRVNNVFTYSCCTKISVDIHVLHQWWR